MKYSSWPFNQTVPVLSSAIWNLLNHLRLRKSTQLNSACIYTSLNYIQMRLIALLSEARSSRSLQSEREATAARTNSQWEETLRRFQANTKREAEEIKIKVESEWPENMLQYSLKTYRKYWSTSNFCSLLAFQGLSITALRLSLHLCPTIQVRRLQQTHRVKHGVLN